jgi:hypothetical protein
MLDHQVSTATQLSVYILNPPKPVKKYLADITNILGCMPENNASLQTYVCRFYQQIKRETITWAEGN